MKKIELENGEDIKESVGTQDVDDDDDNDDNDDDDEEEDEIIDENEIENQNEESIALFVLRSPVTEVEVEKVEDKVRNDIERGMQVIEDTKLTTSDERVKHLKDIFTYDKSQINLEEKSDAEDNDKKELELLENSKITGEPRKYQLALFEKAKEKNIIVNMRTGMGKTLVALLCVKHFSSPAFEEGKQTLFLVPSIALAVQQSLTLRANLPYKVATACHSSSQSDQAKSTLRNANIIVATHGAAEDLFLHYVDVMNMRRFNLIVLDECHYATGNHGYARIMEKLYHPLPKEERPRVLGLTASPLVNVGPKVTHEELHQMLLRLEIMLDAELASFSEEDRKGMELRRAEESLVYFCDGPQEQSLPSCEGIGLHKTRIKELEQLVSLYNEFGPMVTGTYCRTLQREISCNRFEKETMPQFEIMRNHLGAIAEFCEKLCDNDPKNARTDKLTVLETLLENILKEEGEEAVGLIFVDRRITALALYGYTRTKRKAIEKDSSKSYLIKSDMIVRQSTKVFKYLHPSNHINSGNSSNDISPSENFDWLHKTKRVQDVLDGLSRGQTNVLIATSVVEEGVDVNACSFVIVLDNIKTTKAYIQMKGRARKKNAKFFVFHNVHEESKDPALSLRDAQEAEIRVNEFIKLRKSNIPEAIETHPAKIYKGDSTSLEEKALHEGVYRAEHGLADLQSAKSLLNRYSLSIPMDLSSRASRQALLLHMPLYDGYRLTLPAHLPSDVRTVILPEKFRHENMKKTTKQNMLALMACVRLHRLHLLSDRLLPLRRRDIHARLLKVALRKLPSVKHFDTQESPPTSTYVSEFLLYKVTQKGRMFSQHNKALCGGSKLLGLLSFTPLPSYGISDFIFKHIELGEIEIKIEKQDSVIKLDEEKWNLCTRFYNILFDARWRKKTGQFLFRYKFSKEGSSNSKHYIVIPLTENMDIDWERINNIITDFDRPDEEKCRSALNKFANLEKSPRLWQTKYSPNVTYIAYGSSGLKSSANFPYSDMFTDYTDYMLKKHGYKVSPDSPLVVVQRLWFLPRRMRQFDPEFEKQLNKKRLAEEVDDIFQKANAEGELVAGEAAPCFGLDSALLPLDICLEAPFADAALFLQSIIFPQILYRIDRVLTATAFIEHCKLNASVLGNYLEKVPLSDLLESLTARSCSMDISYDRLEYLGDAVLKMIHTDALLYSKDLCHWVGFLHEGDLNALRSAMGSNERLKNTCISLGFDKFILTTPLGRNQWVPVGIEMFLKEEGENCNVDNEKKPLFKPSNKVCADLIESLLGIIYLHFGYWASHEVAENLGVSIPRTIDNDYRNETGPVSLSQSWNDRLKKITASLLGRADFTRTDILLEAITHPSCVHEDVPCYQRLEWVGDAVLCLAAREWVYKQYPDLKVADLAVIETTLVCNETLAYLGSVKGIHKQINHRDPSLPHRFQEFERSLNERRGLWGTDPPKVISDVVEALLGAAFTDKGFDVGQECARYIIEPVTNAVKKKLGESSALTKQKAREMMHPKQVVHEIAGRYFWARCMREDEFAMRFPNCKVWRTDKWDLPKTQNSGAIGQVLCEGLNVIAVAESSAHVAKNRACGLALTVFNRWDDILEKIKTISKEFSIVVTKTVSEVNKKIDTLTCCN